MNLANKSFKNNKTGEVIKVIDSFENIAVLENKGKEDVKKLLDPNLYTEQIDPATFFNTQNAYNNLVDKIKSIPIENIRDDNGEVAVKVGGDSIRPQLNESAIVMSTEEDERAELARKYGVNPQQNDVQRQNQAFAKLLGEEASEELPKTKVVNSQPQTNNVVPIQRVETVDPITAMFKNVKRGVEFKMAIEISNKIPRLDFIEMMEDSYEVSIIDFLATEFTNNLLQNPDTIKQSIKDKINQIVYGAQVTKKSEKIEIDPGKVIKTEPEMVTERVEKKVKVKRAKKED
jgi:hypothetical protein